MPRRTHPSGAPPDHSIEMSLLGSCDKGHCPLPNSACGGRLHANDWQVTHRWPLSRGAEARGAAAPPSCVWPEGTAILHLKMKTPAPPAATDHDDDAEDQGDALCRACARARTAVVPALGRALDHPLAQLLTGLLTVFALFGDDVQRSVLHQRRVDGVAPDGEFCPRALTPSNARAVRRRRVQRRSASSPSTARPTPTTSLA